MRLSRKALDAYNAAIKRQGGNSENAARSALGVWLAENPGASIADTREFCMALMQELGTVYGNAAGDAAYALRAIAADAAGIELPDVDYFYEPDSEFVEKTARYQVEKLKSDDQAGFVDSIADASRYFAERGANDTMAALGKADAKKMGKKVRFARIPTGATTCPYCCMLASRGFAYSSELSALNANHRHCDCRIVEGFEGMTVEGYDPDEYYDRWKNPEKYEGATEESRKKSAIEKIGFSKEYAVAGIKYTNHMERLHKYAETVEPIDGFEDVVIHSDGLLFAWKDLNAETWQEGEIEISAVAFARMLKDDPNYHGGNIRLIACGAGRYDNGAAQMLADLLDVDVFAPIEDALVDKHGKIIVADEELDDIPEYKLDEEFQKSLWKVFHPGGKK